MVMNKKDFDSFCEILEGKDYCNFTEKIKADPSSVTWKCNNDFTFTKKIMKKHFTNYNLSDFIGYCKENGGHCDCEILFNVEVKDVLGGKQE